MSQGRRPATLAQLAPAAGVAKGTVGYHAKVFQNAGLVRAAPSRQVRGGTEQYLEAADPSLRIARDVPVGAGFLIR